MISEAQDEDTVNDVPNLPSDAALAFKQLHEVRGYSQPLFNSAFVEAVRLLEW